MEIRWRNHKQGRGVTVLFDRSEMAAVADSQHYTLPPTVDIAAIFLNPAGEFVNYALEDAEGEPVPSGAFSEIGGQSFEQWLRTLAAKAKSESEIWILQAA